MTEKRSRQRIVAWWYQPKLVPGLWPLAPLSILFTFVAGVRRALFWLRLKKRFVASVPVIVVGNVTVGGTGKTPTVLALIEHFKQQGLRPGVVSRGYGAEGPFPALVSADSSVAAVGDEPSLIAALSGVPVAVSPVRADAVKLLLERSDVNLIIADDGLQHYALGRDIELALVDQERGFGNGWRLPAGPLRESVRRLRNVDFVLLNGDRHDAAHGAVAHLPERITPVAMQLIPLGWRRVADNAEIEVPDGETAIVIAGIGHPERFFNTVKASGIAIAETRVYADHYAYKAADFYDISNQYPVLMTEKDAVKVREFARPHWYYLKVGMQFQEGFLDQLTDRVKALQVEKERMSKGEK